MIKGCRKNIIHVRDTGCPYFEEAYFVVRRGGDITASEDDIVKEATRIAALTADSLKGRKSRVARAIFLSFLYGASVCSIMFGIAAIILS